MGLNSYILDFFESYVTIFEIMQFQYVFVEYTGEGDSGKILFEFQDKKFTVEIEYQDFQKIKEPSTLTYTLSKCPITEIHLPIKGNNLLFESVDKIQYFNEFQRKNDPVECVLLSSIHQDQKFVRICENNFVIVETDLTLAGEELYYN